jgi:hypothetical protein
MGRRNAVQQASRPGTFSRPLERHEQGRICQHEGCCTVLSIYNGTGLCWVHQPLFVRGPYRNWRRELSADPPSGIGARDRHGARNRGRRGERLGKSGSGSV